MTREEKIKTLVNERYGIIKMLEKTEKKLAILRGGGNVDISDIERPDIDLLKNG